jgi:hypothetical protein
LAWVFLPRIEAYDTFEVWPGLESLVHRYDNARGFTANLIGAARVPSVHVRNPDGSLSNLPWDIAAQLQQHAVSLGIALTVFVLWAVVAWQKRADQRTPLFVVTVLASAVLFLAHAVFGGVVVIAVGLVLLGAWLRTPTTARFADGALFAIGVGVIALLHGGLLSFGSQYGASSDVLTLRQRIGYWRGGVPGFLLWNVAGFGLPLMFAIVAWFRPGSIGRGRDTSPRGFALMLLTVFAVFSYVMPQLTFYSSETIGVEHVRDHVSRLSLIGDPVLVPDTAVWGLELLAALGARHPAVLVANQVTLWQTFRLAGIATDLPSLGALRGVDPALGSP